MSRYPRNGSAAAFDDIFCCCQKKMSTTKYVIIKPTAKARCVVAPSELSFFWAGVGAAVALTHSTVRTCPSRQCSPIEHEK